ncbi:MAG TPA: FtsW/RodA/SpoVE family cell cycle protein, partial [Candidatus Sulfotelmatobacter sp.]|nr:FtsW/RodA/SpoVE family cell cycle protein [Candidatus Sulfotelmatobacter sp.]
MKRPSDPEGVVKRWMLRIDPVMLAAVVVLCGLGIFNLAALGEMEMAVRQISAVSLGLVLMVVASRTRLRDWPAIAWGIYGIAVSMLLLLVGIGEASHGARRWFTAGPLALQPSELGKLGVLLVLAHVVGKRQ